MHLNRLIVCSLLVLPVRAEAESVRYDQHAIVRASMRSSADFARASEMSRRMLSEFEWEENVDFLVSQSELAQWLDSGMEFEIVENDVQRRIDDERHRIANYRASGHRDFFAEYQPYDAIVTQLNALHDQEPDRITLHELDPTEEGRTIHAIEIRGQGKNKPVILLNGTIHAREWLSPMTMMYVAQHLVDDYGKDEKVTYLLDRTRVVIIPALNVDGYVYSWENDRLWRKNRKGGYGIDLNRNFAKGWEGSSDQSSETYPGEEAFSEKESQAVRDFVAKNELNVVGFADWHTAITTVMCPYTGGGEDPHHADEHKTWGTEMAKTITATHGQAYGDCGSLGPTLQNRGAGVGLMFSWFVSEGAMGWLIEMRKNSDFVQPPSEILPNAEENYAGFLSSMTHVAEMFGVDGDDDDDDDETSSDTPSGTEDASSEDSSVESESDDSNSDLSADESSESQEDESSAGEESDSSQSSTVENGDDEDETADGDDSADDHTPTADDNLEAESNTGCGCSANSAPHMPWLGFLALIGVRRRARSRGSSV
jgi:hypothetical protein